jgi:hypothetical protein
MAIAGPRLSDLSLAVRKMTTLTRTIYTALSPMLSQSLLRIRAFASIFPFFSPLPLASNWQSLRGMATRIRNFSFAVILAAALCTSGCALMLGGATGAGVGALAGSSNKTTTGESTAIGGAGGAGGGALVGAASGHPLIGALAGGVAGAATGYEVKKNNNGD